MSEESQEVQSPTGTDAVEGEESPELRSILDGLKSLVPQARVAIAKAVDLKALDGVRVEFLGKKGHLTEINKRFGKLSTGERPIAGKMLNLHKGEILSLFKKRSDVLEAKELEAILEKERVDVTLPGLRPTLGAHHPVSIVTRQITEIFMNMGFSLRYGPEVETEWMNFDALNVPPDHPARDMQDTLYADRGFVLRTHTSPTQIRNMLEMEPPWR